MSRRQVAAVVVSIAVVFALSLLAGCAAKKVTPSKPEAVTLEYRLPQGKPLMYRNVQKTSQTMEVMSQYVNIETSKTIDFSISPGEVKDGKQHLTVTIDSMQAGMTSPQGDFTADVGQVIGKSFEMHLSAIGKELDITGADVIQYSVGPGGQRSIKPDFQTIFPNLAGMPTKAGDTWTTADTTNVDEGGMKLEIASDNLNTFEGFETFEGIECARIRTTSTGTVKGEGEQQGTPIMVDSQMEGTDLWFFAYRDGMLAKLTSDVSMKGTVKVGGPQGMEIPMKQQMKIETFIIK